MKTRQEIKSMCSIGIGTTTSREPIDLSRAILEVLLDIRESLVAHLVRERQEQGLDVCDVCWTISWEPTADEAECQLAHPHEKDHVRCAMCWMTAQAAALPKEAP